MKAILSEKVYRAGMMRLWRVFRQQASFPKDADDPSKPNQESLQAWFDELRADRWTDSAFNYCLPYAMRSPYFTQPISMLSGPKGEWINLYQNDRVAHIEKNDADQIQEVKDMPTPDEVKELLADTFNKIEKSKPKGLSGEALDKRKKELLAQAKQVQ